MYVYIIICIVYIYIFIYNLHLQIKDPQVKDHIYLTEPLHTSSDFVYCGTFQFNDSN